MSAASRARAVVVVAASSGGLDPLRKLVAHLRPDIPAAVLVASHIERNRVSRLPELLSGDGPLPVMEAHDRQPLECGRILLAPSHRHIAVTRQGRVRLTSRPADSLVWPWADLLFTSAARAYGPLAMGVVLSGNGDDGAAGLAAIRAAGGIAIVQSPKEAASPSMPLNALSRVRQDAARSPSARIPVLLQHLLQARLAERGVERAPPPRRSAPHVSSLRGLRVLVAGNRYLLGSEMVGMLRELGCSAVGPVPDLASGLRLLDAGVDCAVLDAELQGRQVFPLASALQDRGIPLVFATRSGSGRLPPTWRRCARLEKPFDSKALAAALLLARRKAAAGPAAPPHRFREHAEALEEVANPVMVSKVPARHHEVIVRRAKESAKAADRSVRSTRLRIEASRDVVNRSRVALVALRDRMRKSQASPRSARAAPKNGRRR